MNANGRIANGTNMSNQRRTIGRNMGHLLNFWTWSQAMDRKCPSASAKGPNFGVSLPVPVWESRQGPADRQVSSRLVADIGTVPLTTVAIFWRARIRAVWSGARDLNPGPHGPESHDSSSNMSVSAFFSSIHQVDAPGACRFARIFSP